MPTITSGLRRRLAAAAALLLVPAVVLATPGVADAATTRNRADAAAGWLGRQLDPQSRLVVGDFGPDYGLTADVVLSLDSAKVGRRAATEATRALKRNVLAYTGGGDADEYYAGAFAKLLLVAAAHGSDPRAFGRSARADLVAQLQALECGTRSRTDCTAADKGRFSDVSEFGDFSNPITQSLALISLERTTRRGPSRAAVRYLVSQQCANGSFPMAFGMATCTGSVDATAFAVQALVTVGGGPAEDSARAAGRWLARQQHRNGSFTSDGTRNANSTAVAAQAFEALERTRKARKARAYLRSLQELCRAPRSDRGMIAYNRAGTGDPVRATAQAVPALARATLADISKDGARRALPRLAC